MSHPMQQSCGPFSRAIPRTGARAWQGLRYGLALMTVALSFGCASLAVYPDDSFAARTGKLVARVPLSLITLSASEFRIQRIESGEAFEAYVTDQREKIADARAKAAAATSYVEYQEWVGYADALELELEERTLQRRIAGGRGAASESTGAVGRPGEPDPAEAGEARDVGGGTRPPACVTRREGEALILECDTPASTTATGSAPGAAGESRSTP